MRKKRKASSPQSTAANDTVCVCIAAKACVMSNMSSDRLLKRGCVCVARSPLNTLEEISTKTVDMNTVLYTLGVSISSVQKSEVVLRQRLFKCADSTQKLNEGPMLSVVEIIQPPKFKIILHLLRGLFFLHSPFPNTFSSHSGGHPNWKLKRCQHVCQQEPS